MTDVKTGEGTESKEAELHACRTRRTAAAGLMAESAQPRVDFHSPPASPETEINPLV